jgi:serine O-acetyltransferase
MEKNIIQQDLYRIYGKSLKEVSFFERIFIETNPVVKCQKLFRKFNQYPKNKILKFRYILLSRKYAIDIPIGTNIGEGLYLPHNGRRTINSECIIGKNVTIHPGVTIGKEVRGRRQGSPQIGDNVWIGANAIIVGNIQIGNNVLIAPGSYINFDVPADAVVLGNPGNIIVKKNAVEGYIKNRID